MVRIIATWEFGREACEVGGALLAAGGSALDAVERGCIAVERNPDVHSVGYAGLPNADGVVELDAAIMDGEKHRSGAVVAIQGIATPIAVARRVMEKTPHGMLAGQSAQRFAVREGFVVEDLLTAESRARFAEWNAGGRHGIEMPHFEDDSHDTVGVCALDSAGRLAVGCTTSGLAWKLPGRVGDSPIVGSGLYVDREVGAACATGNGDEILRVALSARVVWEMATGRDPQAASEAAITYLLDRLLGRRSGGCAVIALGRDGRFGAAATRSGFAPPERRWAYAVGDGVDTRVLEGVYIGDTA